MSQNPDDPLSRSMIGRSALRKGILSEADLSAFRREAGEAGGTLSLIEYLLERKGLTPEQVADLLRSNAESARDGAETPVPERGGSYVAPALGTGRGAETTLREEGAAPAGPARSATPSFPAGEVSAGDEPFMIEPAGPSPAASAFSAPPAPSASPALSVSADDDPLWIEPAENAAGGSAGLTEKTRLRPRPVPPADASTPPDNPTSAPRPVPSAGPMESPPHSGTGVSAGYRMRFGYLSVRLGYVTPDQLGVALDTQKFLQKKGKPARLGEILVSQGVLEGKHVLTLLKLQGKTLLRCGGCGARFNAERFDAAHPLPCRKCGKPLAAAGSGDVADAPSAQGTFTNLPAVLVPRSPAGEGGSVVEPSTVRPIPGPAAKESVKRGAGETETPRAALVDAPTLRPSDAQSPPLSEPPARPPSSSRLQKAVGGWEGARVGGPESSRAPRTPARSHPPTLAPSHASTLPEQGYAYKEYKSHEGTVGAPAWLWPACAAGLLAAVTGGWALSRLEDAEPEPRPIVGKSESLGAVRQGSPQVGVSERSSDARSDPPTRGEPSRTTLRPSDAPTSPPVAPAVSVPPLPAPAVIPPEASAISAPLPDSAPPNSPEGTVITQESLLAVPDSPESNAGTDPAIALALVRKSFPEPPREEIQIAADIVLTGEGGVVRLAGRVPEGVPDRTALLLLIHSDFEREGEGQFLHLRAETRQGVFEGGMPDPPPGAYRVVARFDDAQPAEIRDRITPAMRSWRGELRMIAGSPERLGNETLQWAAELLPAASALRRGWPGLVDLHRRTAAGEPPGPGWEEWKSRNPLVPARAALARLEETPESGRIVPRTAAAAADLATVLDAMYVGVARAAGESAPVLFRPGVRAADPPEEVLRGFPDVFRLAIAEDADRMFRAAIGQIADAVERGSDVSAADVERIRKEAGTLEARYEELVRMDGWPPDAAGLTDAFRLLRDLLAAAPRGRGAAEPVLKELRSRLH